MSEDIELLTHRVLELSADIKDMRTEVKAENRELRTSMAKLADAMVSIARIEVTQAQHADAFNKVFASLREHENESEKRFKVLEEAAPISKLISGWVLAWVAGAVGLVGGAVSMKILGI